MNYRKLGSTGKLVSEVGFGAWQLGNDKDWSKMSDDEAIKLVHEAVDLGVNFFDTAPNYGLGKSEQLLGKALKNKRDKVVISTKFGHHRNGVINFDVNILKKSVEESLKTLNTDYVDTILLHNPPFEILNGRYGHFEVLEQLKAEGKICGYGVSVDSSNEMLEIINNTNCQVIEVMYNIFHQETQKAFLSAKQKDVGLIIKVPLDSGWLSGKYNNKSSFYDIRSRWSKEVLERRFALLEEIKAILNNEIDVREAALQFIIANNEISTVIPGSKNLEQLRANINFKNKLSQDKILKLRQFFIDKIQNNPLPW